MASSVVAGSAAKSMWSRVSSVPAKYPFAFGVVFSGCKTSFSDLLVQKVVERREEVDWRRNAAFAAFGFVYLGGVQYAIYVPIFGRLFSSARSFVAKPIKEKVKDFKGMGQAAAQVVIDQCIHHPLMYFPAFYITKEIVMHENPDIKRCLQAYRKNFWEDLQALWKIWVPCTLVNFSFMPFHYRIPFTAGVSLVWTCILSIMRGGDVAHGEDLAGGAVTGATLHILEEGIDAFFTEPYRLESNKSHIVLTLSGRDKTGLVASVARAVADAGGNVTESKMVRLGHEFIILMHVAVDPDKQSNLIKTVKKSPELKELTIRSQVITRRQTGTYQPPTSGVRIRCQGPDKPGMLASIAAALYDAGLSVENVHTELVRGKHGGLDFVCTAEAVAMTYMDYEHIQSMVKELETIKTTLDLEHVDIRVQRLKEIPEDE